MREGEPMASEDEDGNEGLAAFPPSFLEAAAAAGVDPEMLAIFVLGCVTEIVARKALPLIRQAEWELATDSDKYVRDVAAVSCDLDED